MPQFFKGCLDGAGFLAIVEQSGQFGLNSTGHDFAHDGAQDMDGTITGWGRISRIRWLVRILGLAAEKQVAGSTGLSIGHH